MKSQLKNLVVLFFMLFAVEKGYSQIPLPPHIPLSDSCDIVLLTCDPGAELYSLFGHSAVGVYDYRSHRRFVFNYGTFSFNTPNFYLKFAAGKLNYKLSVGSYDRFVDEYREEGRMVVEEPLNLTFTQKQKLFDALLVNYQPENRDYMYDFFFDNCATRILKILEETLGDSLVYTENQKADGNTFRNLIDPYLVNSPWSDFGIDVALGSVVDRVATEHEKVFLPKYLSTYFNHCKVGNQPLVSGTHILVPDRTHFMKTPFLVSPLFVFWLVFLLILGSSFLFKKKSWIIADRIIFSTVGLIGVIVLLLWFATDHDATAGNLNFLWANPLYLIYAWFINGKAYKFMRWLTLLFMVLSVAVLIGWSLIPQQFNFVFIPIIGILLVRLVVLWLRWRSAKH